MKYLIISDLHLRKTFRKSKLTFLLNLIGKADKVIINGDFWEGYEMTFDEFIHSPWQPLFPLLKSKKTVYIYGNHDDKKLSDHRVRLFSEEQTDRYILTSGDKTFVFEHGHRQVPLEGWSIPFIKPYYMQRAATYAHYLAIVVFSASIMRFFFQKLNNHAKKAAREIVGANEFFVMGHTHVAEHDKRRKYINSGFIQFGVAQYLWIENGTVTPVTEKY